MNFLAYFCAVMKCVVYGSTIFFTTQLTESVDVLDLLALRFLLSFAIMWLLKITRVWKIQVGVKDLFKKSEKSPFIKNLVLTAMFEPVLYMLLETLGVSMTTNVTAAVICSLAPISSCIIEEVFLKEKSSFLQKIFLGCGIFGVVYIALNTNTTDGRDTLAGILFLLGSVVAGSFFCAFSRRSSSHFSSIEITYFSCMLGAIAFNAVNVVRHLFRGDILHYFDPYFNPDNLLGFFFLSVVSSILAVMMNNFALARIQISTMAAFGGLSTIVTIVIGMMFGSETLQLYHFIGLPFIFLRMVGVSAISIINEKKKEGQP
ncbi:MAG: DMT family transporter [Clostridia bacterium]|nr:DMT family transporter [Clostridia bacterium]